MVCRGGTRRCVQSKRHGEEMSKLVQAGRPYVAFDPSNKEHRKWFAQFQAQATWRYCPVRFFIDDDAGDLVTMIQRRLIDFYTTKEFGEKARNMAK